LYAAKRLNKNPDLKGRFDIGLLESDQKYRNEVVQSDMVGQALKRKHNLRFQQTDLTPESDKMVRQDKRIEKLASEMGEVDMGLYVKATGDKTVKNTFGLNAAGGTIASKYATLGGTFNRESNLTDLGETTQQLKAANIVRAVEMDDIGQVEATKFNAKNAAKFKEVFANHQGMYKEEGYRPFAWGSPSTWFGYQKGSRPHELLDEEVEQGFVSSMSSTMLLPLVPFSFL
jgi:hypothetical protein